jgi:hypothetical protein
VRIKSRPAIAPAIAYVIEAHKRALQLRQALVGLLQTADEKDATWHDLANDADCVERRLRGVLNAMNNVLTQDPTTYTPLPRSE